ncbi:SDR family oxidoreductase [Bordetella bronchiseptica]|uniref:Beta-D-hydroxybutyrate dehydrogenase n=1 Tax=Bordetella bronchiseptica (strain ATCC BAA-588 / NCTC 13252 / RB50) TaxID=257310 RepID=A0A0H3LYK4_BORBR|nr:SDR family oxidoreductase [Bordetella bronchiseptica]KAK62822.1 3-hydroxybutyrate dehydrogenase [Bordetella bronchiseptica 980-2]AMG90094.1 KR domain-containing protein [Bordetella bronchiseptica]AWP86244.1 beta-D-hydroxybutyrate dehydrogenase [Bordetella bronchiseptica]AWQ11817.1 beta-D-hydroxybutyrate dehydrogenase [Bordetella bronchiseptica]AXT87838.1 beta-D-hydroxybutyrate dehydrogenase [Bordetella bronchiseptica]
MNPARPLHGRCALITGAEAGLGLAIADTLARSGADIVMHCLQANESARQAQAALAREHGVRVLLLQADLRDVDQIEAMAAQALAELPRLDILVNNAVVRHFEPAHELPRAHWDESLAVNLSAAFHLARLALPGMLAQGWGRIINLSSVYGAGAAANRVGYVTTKTALLGLTRALAVETAASGITCNAVAPGTAPTPAIVGRIAEIARRDGVAQEQAEREYLAARQPTGRFVAMENVAALVAFLCSDAGRDITGATLPIDGGWTAA